MKSATHDSKRPIRPSRIILIAVLANATSLLSSLYAQDRINDGNSPTESNIDRLVLKSFEDQGKGDISQSPIRFEMPKLTESVNRTKVERESNPNPFVYDSQKLSASIPSMMLMAGLTFLPAALLMTTSFVRIQITLSLLRQALGSPTIPGNQVIVALSLLLTILVMKPVGEKVYEEAFVPYSTGRVSQSEALRIGAVPIKQFMLAQIQHTGHGEYLQELSEYAANQDSRSRTESETTDSESLKQETYTSVSPDHIPLHVVAPAFLLSELTTALSIGFALYLPFLVVDLVVATLLAAMGIWMMPPTLVSTPAKLILFVLADGWMLTAGALINGFANG